MQQHEPIPVAQYVRMSTDDQQLSIANQEAAIRKYADEHGLKIVATYSDAGKTGLVLRHRKGLRRLLGDVTSGRAVYRAILVYDVSRWGRFQDCDEAAHYEFLCRQSGIPIYYCAEPFMNDGTLPSAIVKALKRTMAAEYSRELSVKVSAGQRRLAELGYWISSRPPYGFRRMMISASGEPKQIMQHGAQKALKTDRTILVPGPKAEVHWVRRIFNMYIQGMGVTAIAHYLNQKRVRFVNNGWDYNAIKRMLRNRKYVGCYLYGKTSGKLRSPRLRVPQKLWVVKPNAFSPIIDLQTFERVQRLMATRTVKHTYSDRELTRKLERLLKQKGRLTSRIINDVPGPHALDYHRHFGSLRQAYKLVGYEMPKRSHAIAEGWKRAVAVREALIQNLLMLFPHNISTTQLPGKLRRVLVVDGLTLVSLIICQSYRTHRNRESWLLKVVETERHLPSVVCLLDDTNGNVDKIYVFPNLAAIRRDQRRYYFGVDDPFLESGTVLTDLSQFYAAIRQAAALATQRTGKSILVLQGGPARGTHARIPIAG